MPTILTQDMYWEDFRMPATSSKTGGSKDPDFAKFVDNGSGSQGVFTYLFDKTTEEELYFIMQLPHQWVEGSEIRPHVHCAPMDTGTGTLRWGLEYTWQNVFGGAFPATQIIYTAATAMPGVAKSHLLLPFTSAIDGTGKTLSSCLFLRVFRDTANDNYNNDAALIELDFHILMEGWRSGSEAEYSKKLQRR
jgi:hypothetical protein